MSLFYILIALAVLVGVLLAISIRAAGGNLALVDHWTAAFKHYSTYGLGLIAFLPEIFNEVIRGGYLEGTEVSDKFSWANKAMVLFTFLVLKLKQAPKPKLPDFGNPGSP